MAAAPFVATNATGPPMQSSLLFPAALVKEPDPIQMLLDPVVVVDAAEFPMKTLFAPVVRAKPDYHPTAVFCAPVRTAPPSD